MRYLILTVALCGSLFRFGTAGAGESRLRVATFNVSLNRAEAGQLTSDLEQSDLQAWKAALILRTIRPDIVLLNEFDYEPDGRSVEMFRERYLAAATVPEDAPPWLRSGLHDTEPLELPYSYAPPVNTGIPSGHDLDHDGRSDGPGDAFGFGRFPGQYGMVVLSRFPIRRDEIRTFGNLLWASMPDADLPADPVTREQWYSTDDLRILRLSSKNHIDVPISVGTEVVHILASHPTPPAFDGPEDRNGCRNHDEIRFWADYLQPERHGPMTDDQGRTEESAAGAKFVIVGDLNADPVDGGSREGAIAQLLDHPKISAGFVPTSEGAPEAARQQGGRNETHRGDPAADTADFSDAAVGNLRVDYVLPSRAGWTVTGGGVFWPKAGSPGAEWTDGSDHHAVWTDLQLP